MQLPVQLEQWYVELGGQVSKLEVSRLPGARTSVYRSSFGGFLITGLGSGKCHWCKVPHRAEALYRKQSAVDLQVGLPQTCCEVTLCLPLLWLPSSLLELEAEQLECASPGSLRPGMANIVKAPCSLRMLPTHCEKERSSGCSLCL